MPDISDKPGARPAASYALLYPHLVELVRPLGYALALHGSMNRDFDMVAIPWTDEAVEPEKVFETIRDAVGGYTGWDTQPGKLMPHGRRCWLIWFNGIKHPFGGGACIDLSIMPMAAAKCTCDAFGIAKSNAARILGASSASKAGKASAANMTKAQRNARAVKAAKARWAKREPAV